MTACKLSHGEEMDGIARMTFSYVPDKDMKPKSSNWPDWLAEWVSVVEMVARVIG
jgi:hypothetical protein